MVKSKDFTMSFNNLNARAPVPFKPAAYADYWTRLARVVVAH